MAVVASLLILLVFGAERGCGGLQGSEVTSAHLPMYIYIYIYIYMYIYIYIEREREIERERCIERDIDIDISILREI